MSLIGGPGGGYVLTARFHGPRAGGQPQYHVNADASAKQLRAELLGGEGKPLLAPRAVVPRNDSVSHALNFGSARGGKAAVQLGAPVQLRFELSEGVHLYFYWIE